MNIENQEESIITNLDMKNKEVRYYSENKNIVQAYDNASGFDLPSQKDEWLQPHITYKIPTGIFLDLPESIEGQIRPRSGLSLRGILVSFGTIDSDYRGELNVIITNTTNDVYKINKYDRIAQVVFQEKTFVNLISSSKEEFSITKRGNNGFGSSGL